MTEIETYRPAEQQPERVALNDPTGGRLVAWAEGLAAAHRIGSALCQTAFAPQHFRGKPEDAAAAIMYGDEIGLTPTQSLRSIFVVSGTPGLYARQMVALVLSKGHEVWTVEKSDARVTVAGRRRGTNHTHEETWTLDRARKAGYTNNKKYTTDPQAMLYARAAADVCRTIAPDALAGLAFSVEELEVADTPTTTVQRSERKTTAQRKTAEPKPEPPEPELDEPAPTEPDPEPAPFSPDTPGMEQFTEKHGFDPITGPQLKKLHALLNEQGYGDRGAGLAFLSEFLDRPVETSKSLSKDEASRVIDFMETSPRPDGAE